MALGIVKATALGTASESTKNEESGLKLECLRVGNTDCGVLFTEEP